jgi:hypothetical protein
MLIQSKHNLSHDVQDCVYLSYARKTTVGVPWRWQLNTSIGCSNNLPKLPQREILSHELLAMLERRPPLDARMRKQIGGGLIALRVLRFDRHGNAVRIWCGA